MQGTAPALSPTSSFAPSVMAATGRVLGGRGDVLMGNSFSLVPSGPLRHPLLMQLVLVASRSNWRRTLALMASQAHRVPEHPPKKLILDHVPLTTLLVCFPDTVPPLHDTTLLQSQPAWLSGQGRMRCQATNKAPAGVGGPKVGATRWWLGGWAGGAKVWELLMPPRKVPLGW